MADKIDETIMEIAAQHGVAVGRDDPILILQTLNERLMRDSVTAQQQILDKFKEELEAISFRWGNDAKNKAERTLNAALVASREAMNKTMQEAAKAAAEAMKREVAEGVGQLAEPIRESKRVAYMNLLAACMVVVAAGMALLAAVL
jgi:hypothetical protein